MKRTGLFAMAIISFVFAHKLNASLRMRPDSECGPRCLSAFMRITGEKNADCDIHCIYGLIGKKPGTVTNLKDLKDAAGRLGLSAEGYNCGRARLKKLNSYSILPIGLAEGTSMSPLHFILVKPAQGDYIN
ncbi:MAG: cysteine peptidase family C39 domain-containing protein, partial [Planctomycetota bacterium]